MTALRHGAVPVALQQAGLPGEVKVSGVVAVPGEGRMGRAAERGEARGGRSREEDKGRAWGRWGCGAK